MRLTQKLAPLFVTLIAALLVLPVISKLQQNPVSANVQKQVQAPAATTQSQSDVKAKTKPTPKPHAPKGDVPSNDNCANAIAITSCPFDSETDTGGATDEVGEPQSTCTLQANSVWYSYAPGNNTANVTVSVCNSDFDTAIMVWQVTGAPCAFANFVAVACNDDFCGDGLQSTVQFTANPNANYKIQIGGFDGETGNLAVHVDCVVFKCPPVVINGTLGSGAPGFTGVQFSGNQTGRLNRNGVASSCATPKSCLIFDPANLRAFDAYKIPNASGQDACVSINLSENSKATCNIQSNAYLDTYVPGSICTGYLGDPGLSTGVPPTATNFSVVVPAGHTLIVVVHTTNPGESGCAYTLTVLGDLCLQFDYCVQDDNNPKRFVQINSTNGAYKFTDCGKGLTLSGIGGVATYFCKTELFDQGPNPKHPDRFVDVLVNPCTNVGDATIQFGSNTITLHDSNIRNNTCACPGAQ
jgi:hypothetical protein